MKLCNNLDETMTLATFKTEMLKKSMYLSININLDKKTKSTVKGCFSNHPLKVFFLTEK